MTRMLRVPRGMPIERIIAAADVTTDETDTQVHPLVTGLLAVFAADGARAYLPGFIEVVTIFVH